MAEKCIFCSIVKGDVPCYKVYEDEEFIAFLDIRPLERGHTLVVPKKHFRWVWDIDDVEAYMCAVRNVANGLRRAMGTDFIASIILGNEVTHAHIHLIPDYKYAIDPKRFKKLSEGEMTEIVEKVKVAMGQGP
jgi:histidine triad (HIT) family protein